MVFLASPSFHKASLRALSRAVIYALKAEPMPSERCDDTAGTLGDRSEGTDFEQIDLIARSQTGKSAAD